MTTTTCPTPTAPATPAVETARPRAWRENPWQAGSWHTALRYPTTGLRLKRPHAQPTYRFGYHRFPDGEPHRT